jgi:hypothetical protein
MKMEMRTQANTNDVDDEDGCEQSEKQKQTGDA